MYALFEGKIEWLSQKEVTWIIDWFLAWGWKQFYVGKHQEWICWLFRMRWWDVFISIGEYGIEDRS